MTVAELIEELKKLPPNLKVLLQVDPEGNGFHSVAGAEAGWTDNPEEWRIEYVYGEDDEDFPDKCEPNCVVVWPS